MENSFSKEPFEKISNYDFTQFTQEDWNEFVQSVASYFQKYKGLENPYKVDVCVFNKEPMVVLTFDAKTYGRKNKTYNISVTAFEAELNFIPNSTITKRWRKFMSKKFGTVFDKDLDVYIDAKDLNV